MKQNWKYKFLAIVFTAVVIFPFLVQASHALEKHEHNICHAEYEKHYHQDEADCSICLFQIKHQTFDFSSNFSSENFTILKQQNFEVYCAKYIFYSKHKSSRAPPYFLV